ncbi:MAG: GAF domain-containing protein [Deltaproteobacteria bacterium]|nr:GAF domain-containing protein [Deltaproteobacteria bacterium]
MDKPITIPETVTRNWQGIVDILAEIVGIPAALIMRVDDPAIEVFLASDSPANPYHPGDSEHLWGSGLYCETVIKAQNKLIVPNALEDPDWEDNPDTKLNMIAYLGYPVLYPDRRPFGTLCVLDKKTNPFSKTTEQLMLRFKELLESHIALLHWNQALGDENKNLNDYAREIQALRGIVPICASCKKIRDRDNCWHHVESYIEKGYPEAALSHTCCPECARKLYPEFNYQG